MNEVLNFENGAQRFNIHLGSDGNLSFLANGVDGFGDFRMAIVDESGVVTIGGGSSSGALQIRGPDNESTIFLGMSGTEANALLGGSGFSGRLQVFDSSNRKTADLIGEQGRFDLGGVGNDGSLFLQDDTGSTTISLKADSGELRLTTPGSGSQAELKSEGRLQLFNSGSDVTVDLRGDVGRLTLGGGGEDGRLDMKNAANDNTTFLSMSGTEVNVFLGGGSDGLSGRLQVFDSSNRKTAELNGENGRLDLGGVGNNGILDLRDDTDSTTIILRAATGDLSLTTPTPDSGSRAELKSEGRLQLFNSGSDVTVDLRGDVGRLTLGGNGEDGRIDMKNAAGDITITVDGGTGTVTEVSDVRLKTNIAPLTNALDSVLALRGVRYQRKQEQVTGPMASAARVAQKVGFVGQEVESVCPELVATDAEGYKSVSYSRLTAFLVEAVKEQQQLIREQAAALEIISERLRQPSEPTQGQ